MNKVVNTRAMDKLKKQPCPNCDGKLDPCYEEFRGINQYWLCPKCKYTTPTIGREKKIKPEDYQ